MERFAVAYLAGDLAASDAASTQENNLESAIELLEAAMVETNA